jgi:prefoldin subunit 5
LFFLVGTRTKELPNSDKVDIIGDKIDIVQTKVEKLTKRQSKLQTALDHAINLDKLAFKCECDGKIMVFLLFLV